MCKSGDEQNKKTHVSGVGYEVYWFAHDVASARAMPMTMNVKQNLKHCLHIITKTYIHIHTQHINIQTLRNVDIQIYTFTIIDIF